MDYWSLDCSSISTLFQNYLYEMFNKMSVQILIHSEKRGEVCERKL